MKFSDLAGYARRKMRPEIWRRFNLDQPSDHAPVWHQFGMKSHLMLVSQAAAELSRLSCVDIRDIALLHDIGKVGQFRRAIKLADAGSDPAPAFFAHEARSARIAVKDFGMSEADSVVIACHAMAYDQTPPQTVVTKLVTYGASVERWMLLCAADQVGKGWLPTHVAQRLVIAQRFRDVSAILGLSLFNASLALAIEAVEKWTPEDISKEVI